MKVKDVMTHKVVHVEPETSVSAAARMLSHYNIGMVPVCAEDGSLQGVMTDRDIVTRCLAAERLPGKTRVGEIMTSRVSSVAPDMDLGVAAHLMGRLQVRRLPVVENGKLCGIVSLGDLAGNEESIYDAADALSEITGNISER